MGTSNVSSKVIYLAVALFIIATVMPIAIALISNAENAVVTINGTDTTLGAVADSTVVTLLGTLLPIIAIISIILYFVPKMKGG